MTGSILGSTLISRLVVRVTVAVFGSQGNNFVSDALRLRAFEREGEPREPCRRCIVASTR